MIIDSHVHLPSPVKTWEWAPFTEDMAGCCSYLRRCRVDWAVANSTRAVIASTSGEVTAGNDETLAAAAEYEGLIVPAAIVNPECDGAIEELERCRKAGIVWLGEICGYAAGFDYATAQFEAVVAKAVELDMVVHVHSSAAEMRRLCEKFPSGTFILPHPASTGADVEERVGMLRDFDGLYLDLCGHGYERMGILEAAVGIDPKRVLFGSDFTINDPSAVIARIEHSYLSDDQKALILGGNAARLLRDRGVETANGD